MYSPLTAGDLRSKVWGRGRPQNTCYHRRREGREGGHLPGPITHAGKIESDYQTQDLDINIRAVEEAGGRSHLTDESRDQYHEREHAVVEMSRKAPAF